MLSETLQDNELLHKLNIIQKLNQLYQGTILLPNNSDKYINISPIKVTEKQRQFLNLDPNCHHIKQYDIYLDKKRNRNTP